jgi:hypothetical protein
MVSEGGMVSGTISPSDTIFPASSGTTQDNERTRLKGTIHGLTVIAVPANEPLNSVPTRAATLKFVALGTELGAV